MKPKSAHLAISACLLIGCQFIYAQNVAINTGGNSARTGAILDLSNNNSNGSTGFLPPYVVLTSLSTAGNSNSLTTVITGGANANLSGLLVYNTSTSTSNGLSGPGLYYWNSTLNSGNGSWVYLGAASSISGSGTPNYLARWITASTLGSGVTQDNGTSVGISTAAITPKSLMDINGNVSVGTYAGNNAAPANGMIVSGQVGIGNNAPNSKAIVDLTNSSNLGLMLPGITTANLPAITAAQNGLIVFNTTLGCPEYAYNGSWIVIGSSHGSTSFAYTGGIQSWTVPPCINTVTITATGAAGGTSTDYIGGNGATVTQTFTVIAGHTLNILVGNFTTGNDYAGGGGGGSFVWDNASTNYPMIAAGGGGGGGFTSAGANASTTLTPTNSTGGAGAGGTNGTAGTAGSTAAKGGGGAGGGWNTTAAQESPTAATANAGQGGSGEPAGFSGGASATTDATGSQGGYGGGGGGGYDNSSTWGAGGGGGGYNGGGGGNAPSNANQYGGGGGGSGYYNGQYPYTTAADFVSPTSASSSNTGIGSVTINY